MFAPYINLSQHLSLASQVLDFQMKHQSYLSTAVILVLFYLSINQKGVMAQNGSINKSVELFHVGVIFDTETWIGKTSLSSISMALSDFYETHYHKTRLVLHTRDSKEDVIPAASAALDLLKNVEVQAIIGPQKSGHAKFIVELGDKAHVPIISSSATSPSLSSIRTPYFIRTALNDSIQAKAIASIVQAFGWREIIPVYEDTEYGSGMIPYLTDALQEVNTRVTFRSVIDVSATEDQILEELYKLATMQTRVFVVHMSTISARFFPMVRKAGLMSQGFVWIATDGVMNLLDSMDSSVIDSMQGVLGVRPYVPKSKMLDDFMVRWRRKMRQENWDVEGTEPSIFGLWAYDSVKMLAMAAERVGAADSYSRPSKVSETLTDLLTVGVSRTGPRLLQEILKTQFKGLQGNFHPVNGQLQSTTFQIVNVNGRGPREVGFWGPKYGLSQVLNPSSKRMNPTSRVDLKAILWPGEVTAVAKGWVMPTNGKKLKIGVPVKEDFYEFVKVEKDSHTNSTIVTGFCIDVFAAVIEALPYAVPYEFVPFQLANGQSAGSYNDLVYQVYLQNYDAVVGDVTIRANRSQFVDFTLPYTESGVAMVVPIKDDDKKNPWIFLKPLSRDLWLVIGFSFVFIGSIIWVLEHRINDEFRGSFAQQVGTIFWFSFSTLVFAHKEKINNNLARFVLIIWMFVVLILTSSYTASLTSMLTVQRLQPTVTDVAELIRNRDYVGYPDGSFVKELLKQMKFEESRLKVYKTLEQYDEDLSKGSQNGGVAAIFHEFPYIKLFLSKYCDKYTLVGPTLKTAGFGFVLPKGFPLVPDISKAILEVTEGEKMVAIEQAWFGHKTTCPDKSASVSSQSLTFYSFRGLFIIIGISSTSALFIYLALFLYKSKHIFTSRDSNDSIKQKCIAIVKHFDEKEESSTAKRSKSGNTLVADVKGSDDVPHSPTTEGRPSLSGSDGDYISSEDTQPFSGFTTPSPDIRTPREN